MTIATDSGGRQRTPTDGLSQARHAAALAVGACTWLRDEEAKSQVVEEIIVLARQLVLSATSRLSTERPGNRQSKTLVVSTGSRTVMVIITSMGEFDSA